MDRKKIGAAHRFFRAKKEPHFDTFISNDVVVMCIKISVRVATIANGKEEFNFYEKDLHCF